MSKVDWQLGETAPKNGTEILGVMYHQHYPPYINIIMWDNDGNGGEDWVSARCVDGLRSPGTLKYWSLLPKMPDE